MATTTSEVSLSIANTGERTEGSIKKKVFTFLEKLQANPASPGLHIEPIQVCVDPRVRTGRVDDQYRAVLFELHGKGHTHFVYVATYNHDEAYQKAATLRLDVNPVNGITQLIEETAPTTPTYQPPAVAPQPEPAADAAAAEPAAQPLLVQYTPEQLHAELGVNPATTTLVQTLTAESALDGALTQAAHSIPLWESDAILALQAGYSIDEVKQSLSLNTDTPVTDRESDAAAIEGLRAPASKMQFAFADDQESLRLAWESMDWAQWRVYPHPEQEKVIAAHFRGSGRVSGGAGTGKTVVAVHRANRLASGSKRVILTTFTKALAESLKQQMDALNPHFQEATAPGMAGLHITSVDVLVAAVLAEATTAELTAACEAVYGTALPIRPRPLDDRSARTFWSESSDLTGHDYPVTFLSQEYELVVLGGAVTSLAEYRRTPRTGRGRSLNRAARGQVWEIIEVFRRKCATAERMTYPMLAAAAAHILTQRQSTAPESYRGLADHILIDEAQDFHAGHWRFLRAAVPVGPDDIFISEDSHQRIYGQRLVLERFGISTRGRASTRLTLNYRTTKENLGYALGVLRGEEYLDSSGELDSTANYRSARSGPEPIVVQCSGPAEELTATTQQIAAWLEDTPDAHIGVLVRTNAHVQRLLSELTDHGIAASAEHHQRADTTSPVLVMTMHMAKGMEFTHVVIVGASADQLPPSYVTSGMDDEERADQLRKERSLLYVAASRARDVLMVTVSGERSPMLP